MSKGENKSSPFQVLKSLRSKLAEEEKQKAEAEKKARIEKEKKKLAAKEESDLFAEAMAGVQRIERTPPKPKKIPREPVQTSADEDEEVIQELQDIVDGRAPLDFTWSDEFVEGRAQDCSKLDLSKLRSGDYSVQSHIDLHGKNREEARQALLGFFTESMRKNLRCVLVICGRGLHTPGGKPVLKELLVRWLIQGRLSTFVLAFCSAKAHDGGVGALYVLLRRRPKDFS